MKRYLAFLSRRRPSSAAQRTAHHSFAATYLEDQTVTVEGELVQFLFRNPHSFVHVMVKEKDGTMVRYAVEWGGAGQLGGQGVTRETLKAGDHVIIAAPRAQPGGSPRAHGHPASPEGRLRLGQRPGRDCRLIAGSEGLAFPDATEHRAIHPLGLQRPPFQAAVVVFEVRLKPDTTVV